jgi:hypothetical protein
MTGRPLLDRLGDGFGHLLRTLHEYLIAGAKRRGEPIRDTLVLRRFVETRSAYIAQTSLYGYLRTRAGMRYPELFDDDPFVASINAAKWHMWLACLSDLSVYTGGMLQRQASDPATDAGPLIRETLERILAETGLPPDADGDFPEHAERVRLRIVQCDWNGIADDERAFNQSPAALVRHAPIVENLKELDAPVVHNSVRFHWQEVRRDLREHLDADAVMRDYLAGSGSN